MCRNILNYEDIRDFINGEEGNGCLLLTTKEEFKEDKIKYNVDNTSIKLRIQCKCGKNSIFITSYNQFKFKNKRQCNQCGNIIRVYKNTSNYKDIKYFIEVESESGCKLKSLTYTNNHTDLDIECKCENQFKTTYINFVYGNKRQCDECSGQVHWDYETSKKYVESLGYILITDDIGRKDQWFTIKDEIGYYYVTTINQLKRGCKPQRFQNNNPYTIQNIKLWCLLNNKSFKLISEIYDGNKIKLEWQCLKESCGEFFESTWNQIFDGENCPYCSSKKVGLSNCLATKSPCLASQWHPTRNGELTPYDVFPNDNKKYWWLCQDCGHEWYVSPNSRFSHKNEERGCPNCYRSSKGERLTASILEKKNKIYQKQFQFEDLVSDKNYHLRYDFGVLYCDLNDGILNNKDNLRGLIEFQGRQHYKWVDYLMTYEEFERLQKHDQMKLEYCEINNIPLLRIPHWDIKNIEQIIDDFLVSLEENIK